MSRTGFDPVKGANGEGWSARASNVDDAETPPSSRWWLASHATSALAAFRLRTSERLFVTLAAAHRPGLPQSGHPPDGSAPVSQRHESAFLRSRVVRAGTDQSVVFHLLDDVGGP